MNILNRALVGSSSKAALSPKEGDNPARPESLKESSGLDELQKEALSDADKQLADLQQRRAQKKARTGDNALDTRRHAPIHASATHKGKILGG